MSVVVQMQMAFTGEGNEEEMMNGRTAVHTLTGKARSKLHTRFGVSKQRFNSLYNALCLATESTEICLLCNYPHMMQNEKQTIHDNVGKKHKQKNKNVKKKKKTMNVPNLDR
jgi:hypothetical protein